MLHAAGQADRRAFAAVHYLAPPGQLRTLRDARLADFGAVRRSRLSMHRPGRPNLLAFWAPESQRLVDGLSFAKKNCANVRDCEISLGVEADLPRRESRSSFRVTAAPHATILVMPFRIPIVLTLPEIDALVLEARSAADRARTPAAALGAWRDFVMVQTGLLAGPRVSELCDLEVTDIDLAGAVLAIRHGKGNGPSSIRASKARKLV